MSFDQFRSNLTYKAYIQQHFYGGLGAGEAVHYSNIWLPHNCSYHRFTSTSIHACSKYTLANMPRHVIDPMAAAKKLHIYFYGDSALRGIINGILHRFDFAF